MTLPMKSRRDISDYRNVEGIAAIVKNGLCHRCGACVGICPAGTLSLNSEGFPKQTSECINCNRCVQVCSGIVVDYETMGRDMFGETYRYGPALGEFIDTVVAHATDEEIRWCGASGGVITQLLVYLLESGQIKGALVAVQHRDDPSMGEGILARSREELVAAAQSRYTTTPSLTALKDMSGEDGPFAVVGLPCQIHSVRMLQKVDKRWARKVVFTIGLVCSHNPPCIATREVAAMFSRGKTQLEKTHYRQSDQRGWPHDTVELKYTNGEVRRSPFGPAETVTLLKNLYPLGRCLMCVDATAEFADIGVADPWIRNEKGYWRYTDPGGWSSLIVRTEKARQYLQSAVDAGKLVMHPQPPAEIEAGQYRMMSTKKVKVPCRLLWRKWFGWPVPLVTASLPKSSPWLMALSLVYMTTRVIPVWKPFRLFLLRLGFSRVGIRLMAFRKEQKRRKAVEKAARL